MTKAQVVTAIATAAAILIVTVTGVILVDAYLRPNPDQNGIRGWTSDRPPRVVFVGDEFIEDDRRSYVAITSDALCWQPISFGRSGTGYLRGNYFRKSYRNQVANIVRTRPDILIIQTSVFESTEPIGGSVQETLNSLRTQLPNATIIAIGPVIAPGLNADRLQRMSDEVAYYAHYADVHFLDATAWLPGSDFFTRDGLHPNEAGQETFAQNLVSAVQEKLSACG